MKRALIAIFASLFASAAFGAHPASNPISVETYERHIKELNSKLPTDFSILIQKPFIVITNDTPENLKSYSTGTIKWAVDHLKKDYFTKDPDQLIDIYLFKDAASYQQYNRKLFHTKPTTPYGYYSPSNHALVMNIATGGGTLLHEIVHPFMRANFPECPAWFNEGLGSLYEQSAQRDGHIVGLTNWRLAGLQKAIQKDEVPAFEALLSTTDQEFYNEDPGTHYSQARYLCYYLQEKDLLHTFYHQFLANHEKDPTGIETLKNVLKTDDLKSFQKDWQDWVMKLHFP